ncbi:AAA family ATPase [Pseudanabaena sp. PCC 6802]|uniref:AAA family ATPase n=1 Tax=Pseudanabaena sp. PCC 6802 TaxID=118173 RepID=UPI00034BBD45|nr:AAA family ATPase [Pseudanabaena sp. PCC 6802]
MKIHQLEVKNFRGFERETFRFSDRFNLLIGDNGSGKTAVLDALAIAAGTFSERFVGLRHNIYDDKSRIRDTDIRQVNLKNGQNLSREYQYPVEVSCQAVINDREISWTKSVVYNVRSITHEISIALQQIQAKVQAGEHITLPLIVYYGTGRLWQKKKRNEIELPNSIPRTFVYEDCLDPRSNLILDWFKVVDIPFLQEQNAFVLLNVVEEALSICDVEGWQSFTYNKREDNLIATAKDSRTFPFDMLSDGIRNMLGMVADIAFRAAVLNPHLGSEAARKTPGIVLIDEIDLHLHPKWQRRVVEDLKRTFPEIQFFATTHSPFMIQSLRLGELINLDRRPGEYYNKSIEDIAEDVMGVELPQHSERWQDMMKAAEEYYRVLQASQEASPEEVERLKVKLDELSMPYSDDPAYHAFLKMERTAAGL